MHAKVSLLIALIVPAFAHAVTTTTIYDSRLGTQPAAQGFTAIVDSHDTVSLSNSLLDVDAYSQGVNSREAYYSDIDGTFDLSSFVMETTVQIIQSNQQSGPHGTNYPRGGFVMGAEDDSQRTIQLEFVTNGLWMQTSNGIAQAPPTTDFFSFDTTDALHTYRVVGSGTSLDLFIDGALTPSLTFNDSSLQTYTGGARDQFYVGDASDLTRSHYKLQTALFSSDVNAQVSSTPEPSSFALEATALAALVLTVFRKPLTNG